MAHKTNLVIQILFHLLMVNKIEGFLSTLYIYFCKSCKRHLDFTKFAKIMEIKKAKILKNVKTQWISMLSLAKHVMEKYKTLSIKMAIDSLSNEKPKANFDFLCDVQVMLEFTAILPFL